LHLNQSNQSRRNEQFVSNGIEQRTDRRDLFPTPCEIAIEEIGGRGKPENQQGNQVITNDRPIPVEYDSLLNQYSDKQWDKEYSRYRQAVRNIHTGRPAVEITQL
jgi:hypothetical protein